MALWIAAAPAENATVALWTTPAAGGIAGVPAAPVSRNAVTPARVVPTSAFSPLGVVPR